MFNWILLIMIVEINVVLCCNYDYIICIIIGVFFIVCVIWCFWLMDKYEYLFFYVYK